MNNSPSYKVIKRQIFSKEKNKKFFHDDSYEEFRKEFDKLKVKERKRSIEFYK